MSGERRLKPVEFYVEGITLQEALREGLVDKFIGILEERGPG